MNDIGLIQLEHLVNFTSFIRPICLISSNSFPLRIQSYLIVSGWGATENSSSSDIKRKVSVPLQNNSACENLRTWEHNKISSEHLCAGGEPGRDSCPGDSGGPLMKRYRNAIGDIQWVQVGIVSFGAGCGVRGRPAVYVKVASYADWIVNVISDNGDSCKTPNEALAKCVPISDCRVILQAISSFQDDAIKFAKQSQCGHDESPLVCCGTVGTFIDLKHTITTERPRLYERPADPSYKAEPVTHLLVPPGSVCGRVSKKYRERAGKIAGPYEFPWVVTLQYKHLDGTPAGSLCSGSLINHRYVLTSATCLEIDGYNLASIHLGEWDFDKSGDGYDYYRDENSGHTFKRRQDYTIVETEAHPYFNKRSGNNGIALIRILETIAFDDYIRPICIPPKNFPPPLEHGPMETAGWNANADGFLIGKKLKAHHTAVSVAECDLTYPNFTYNFPNKICTRTADDSTIEDSGRPLVRRYEYDPTADEPQWFQEGILYKDKPENSKSKLVLYLRVARYHTWILNNLKKS